MAHRRRGVGVGRSGASKYAQKKADEIKAVSLQSAIDTVEKLEVKLTEFAEKHQSEIKNDPVFRQRFLQMCAPLGVDPLMSSKKTSFWGKLLGNMSDFYYELAVKVAEVCLASRNRNGGIMSVTEVQSILSKRKTKFGTASAVGSTSSSSSKRRGSQRRQQQDGQNAISQADILIAIEKLGKLGGGFRTVTVGSSTMVVSVPTELDNDHMQVMTVAQQHGGGDDGGISVDQVQEATGWNRDRTERALDLLLHEGMAWLDRHNGQTYYWFPSVWQEEQEPQEAEE